MAGVFETIPVDRQGRTTVTLDYEKLLSFTNAALPRGLVTSLSPTLHRLSLVR
jgi:hypothetical protein